MRMGRALRLLARLLLLSVGVLFSNIGQATTIGFSVLPDGAIFNKQVISMSALRFVHVVKQNTDFSCGAAALATILKYAYDMNVTEDSVTKGLMRISDPKTVREKGFSLLDLKHYTEILGLQAHGYRVKTEQLKLLKIPTIVLLDIKGYKHFAVITKVTPDKIYLADPALGNRVSTPAEFDQSWNHLLFIVTGKGYDPQTVLTRPPEPLSARKQVNIFHPQPDAELLDFGYIHADLF